MLNVELDQETEAYLADILAQEKTTSDELLKRLIYQHWLSLQPRKSLTEKPGEPPEHLPHHENQQGAIATKPRRRVPLGSPIFPDRPPLSPEEKARRKAENEAFAKRCREIFDRVYPELVVEHYGWAIMIEPDSGDYFIAPDPEVAFQKARQKHPTARILEKCLNETGTCGRI